MKQPHVFLATSLAFALVTGGFPTPLSERDVAIVKENYASQNLLPFFYQPDELNAELGNRGRRAVMTPQDPPVLELAVICALRLCPGGKTSPKNFRLQTRSMYLLDGLGKAYLSMSRPDTFPSASREDHAHLKKRSLEDSPVFTNIKLLRRTDKTVKSKLGLAMKKVIGSRKGTTKAESEKEEESSKSNSNGSRRSSQGGSRKKNDSSVQNLRQRPSRNASGSDKRNGDTLETFTNGDNPNQPKQGNNLAQGQSNQVIGGGENTGNRLTNSAIPRNPSTVVRVGESMTKKSDADAGKKSPSKNTRPNNQPKKSAQEISEEIMQRQEKGKKDAEKREKKMKKYEDKIDLIRKPQAELYPPLFTKEERERRGIKEDPLIPKPEDEHLLEKYRIRTPSAREHLDFRLKKAPKFGRFLENVDHKVNSFRENMRRKTRKLFPKRRKTNFIRHYDTIPISRTHSLPSSDSRKTVSTDTSENRNKPPAPYRPSSRASRSPSFRSISTSMVAHFGQHPIVEDFKEAFDPKKKKRYDRRPDQYVAKPTLDQKYNHKALGKQKTVYPTDTNTGRDERTFRAELKHRFKGFGPMKRWAVGPEDERKKFIANWVSDSYHHFSPHPHDETRMTTKWARRRLDRSETADFMLDPFNPAKFPERYLQVAQANKAQVEYPLQREGKPTRAGRPSFQVARNPLYLWTAGDHEPFIAKEDVGICQDWTRTQLTKEKVECDNEAQKLQMASQPSQKKPIQGLQGKISGPPSMIGAPPPSIVTPSQAPTQASRRTGISKASYRSKVSTIAPSTLAQIFQSKASEKQRARKEAQRRQQELKDRQGKALEEKRKMSIWEKYRRGDLFAGKKQRNKWFKKDTIEIYKPTKQMFDPDPNNAEYSSTDRYSELMKGEGGSHGDQRSQIDPFEESMSISATKIPGMKLGGSGQKPTTNRANTLQIGDKKGLQQAIESRPELNEQNLLKMQKLQASNTKRPESARQGTGGPKTQMPISDHDQQQDSNDINSYMNKFMSTYLNNYMNNYGTTFQNSPHLHPELQDYRPSSQKIQVPQNQLNPTSMPQYQNFYTNPSGAWGQQMQGYQAQLQNSQLYQSFPPGESFQSAYHRPMISNEGIPIQHDNHQNLPSIRRQPATALSDQKGPAIQPQEQQQQPKPQQQQQPKKQPQMKLNG